MYIPEKYRNEDLSEVSEFIRANPFGILVTSADGTVMASHIPMMPEKNQGEVKILEGHLARANQQSEQLYTGMEALAIFNGPHAYISSSWYKEEEVPTWNYVAVHVRGTIQLLDEDGLKNSLDKLVRHHESRAGYPTKISDYSSKTMRQMRAILGFHLQISSVKAAYKLSQGREEDHEAIVENLQKDPDMGREIAKMMQLKTRRK